jgi:hydrogenase/urease accessory protein HupE
MMEFLQWVGIGVKHILDFAAMDHMLFITAVCFSYHTFSIKHLFWLVTAFTLGHGITLYTTFLGIRPISSEWVEHIILISIVFMALKNIIDIKNKTTNFWMGFGIVAIFGLFHGMGFSGFIQQLLGESNEILLPLFGFNLGIELAQLTIVVFWAFIIKLLSKNRYLAYNKLKGIISLAILVATFYLILK